MRLQDADTPLACWHYAERYLGGGTRNYSPYAQDFDVSSEYHPQVGADSFTLPSFLGRPEWGELVTNNISSPLPSIYHDGERLLLPVYPDTLTCDDLVHREELLRCEKGSPLQVVPLANVRTVCVTAIDGKPVPPHMLKLHYPRRLSRFNRRLPRSIIDLNLWVADELACAGLPLLPEVCGGVFGFGAHAWGFVVSCLIED